MKLERTTHDPGSLVEFYEQGLTHLGAVCERTWFDRLEILAEGPAAKLWNSDGSLYASELHFVSADASSARDAAREVFPGCPLTFRLAEALRSAPLPLERFVLPESNSARTPDTAVVEKLWRAQFPDTSRWQLGSPFKAGFHFSLFCLARCEIQAIDQHWSLHRLAVALPGGEPDDDLAQEISFHQGGPGAAGEVPWPAVDPTRWSAVLGAAFEYELKEELAQVRVRQEHSLQRELERIDGYFEHYEQELTARARRASKGSGIKAAERLAAAKAEHSRRRADQIGRHEIRVHPHIDALLLVAESAWRSELRVEQAHRLQAMQALFVPRLRRWIPEIVPATQ